MGKGKDRIPGLLTVDGNGNGNGNWGGDTG